MSTPLFGEPATVWLLFASTDVATFGERFLLLSVIVVETCGGVLGTTGGELAGSVGVAADLIDSSVACPMRR